MRKLSLSVVGRLVSLRKSGHSYKEIAKELGIGVGTAYGYGRNVKVTPKGVERLRKREAESRRRFALLYARPKPFRIPDALSLREVRVIGHCIFDGAVYDGTIRYTNSSEALIEEFMGDMESVFGVLPTYRKRCRGNTDYYALCYCNAGVARHLLTYTPSYSTSSPLCSIPGEIIEDTVFAKELLRTFWDDEGSISEKGDIEGGTKSETVARQLVAMHEKVGVGVRLYRRSRCGGFRIYVLRDRENLRNFRDIGFRHSIVTQGRLKGMRRIDAFDRLYRFSGRMAGPGEADG
ncbi:TPA: hypothetical protein EYP44_02855 [Candidatus Bathyarchaeota archaeon]|nr:hypothetical protein [Candidatus Bathyarchaeota archaeon]